MQVFGFSSTVARAEKIVCRGPVRRVEADGSKHVETALSSPPEGKTHWTVRALAAALSVIIERAQAGLSRA